MILIEPDSKIPEEQLERCRDVLEEKLMHANPAYGEMVRSGPGHRFAAETALFLPHEGTVWKQCKKKLTDLSGERDILWEYCPAGTLGTPVPMFPA